MRTLIVLLFLVSVAFARAQVVPDVRMVDSTRVDLTPLKVWLKQREGERPLAHWKEVRVLTPPDNLGRTLVTVDNSTRAIILRNADSAIPKYFAERDALETRIAELGSYIVREEARLRRLDAVTPTIVTGDYWYVRRIMNRRASVNLGFARLAERRNELSRLQSQLDEAEAAAAEITSQFAMFTGRNHAGREVWDCGRRLVQAR